MIKHTEKRFTCITIPVSDTTGTGRVSFSKPNGMLFIGIARFMGMFLMHDLQGLQEIIILGTSNCQQSR